MTSLLSRVKKLETAWDEKNPSSRLRVVVVYFGEDEARAIARANIGPYDQVVLVNKFASKKAPMPKQPKSEKTIMPANIDAEIAKLKNELKQDGLTEEQIDQLVAADPDDGVLTVEPSRSDIRGLTR